MPLPHNTSLSLLGYSRPGDAVQSKPKKAMIIRMSTETLDALESFPNHPQMEFDLGANPRIYIGETSFSMRYAQETTLHELYLRASSITKKTAPLKLYANVVSRFTVERELHDDVYDKLRESTQDAVNQRMTHATQFIEKPLEIQYNNKRRKEPLPPSTMFRKPIRQSDKAMSTSSGASNLANVPNQTSALTAQGSRENTKLETPKRGVSSQEAHPKKAKQKSDPKAEIIMKDEAVKVNYPLNQAGMRDAEMTQTKRMQGMSRESLTMDHNHSGLNYKPAKSKRTNTDTSQTVGAKSQNARSLQDDGYSQPGKFPACDRERRNISSEVVRRRYDKGPEPSDSEREGRQLQTDIDKTRGRAAGREGESRIDDKSSLFKRKTTNQDDNEYFDAKSQSLPQKRRKTEPPVIHNPTSTLLPRDDKPKGSLTLNKSNLEPRTRMNIATGDLPALPSSSTIKKKDPPPGLPSKHTHYSKVKISSDTASSSYLLPSHEEGPKVRHGSTKIRRRSPIYTSSEDEESPLSNRVSSHSSSLATLSTQSHPYLSSNRTASRTRPVTTDHATLRSRYSTAYLEYLTSLQKLVLQRRMVDEMLKTSDSGSVNSVIDPVCEVELLHPEELARLAADHRKRHEELVSIQQIFEKSCTT